MQFQNRTYQNLFLADINEASKEFRSICCVLPTGGGKTVCFATLVAKMQAQGLSAHLLSHRQEISEQISAKLSDFGVNHGFVMQGHSRTRKPIQVGMIQTYRNRLSEMQPPDLLVIDECHHTPAAAYMKIINSMPAETTILGFTATPERLDGKGLHTIFDTMVEGPSTPELISLGYLVPPVVYAPTLVDTSGLHKKFGDFAKNETEELVDKTTITGDVIEHYRKYADKTSAVAFCVSIAHAEHVAEQFNLAGIPAASIDGGMNRFVRKKILDRFRSGEILVLCSADLISEGFDLPKIETVIMLRPTESLSLYLQQVGRGLRPEPGKERAIILDHVGNTMRFGLPDIERNWSLLGARAREGDPEVDVHTCRVCYRAYTGQTCPDCKVLGLTGLNMKGYSQREDRMDQIVHVEGELKQVQSTRQWLRAEEIGDLMNCQTHDEFVRYCTSKEISFELAKKCITKRASNLEQLIKVGQLLNYKPGWAQHRWEHSGGPLPGQIQMEMPK